MLDCSMTGRDLDLAIRTAAAASSTRRKEEGKGEIWDSFRLAQIICQPNNWTKSLDNPRGGPRGA
jgi:hypothetical protein